jgi:hypothetical protein
MVLVARSAGTLRTLEKVIVMAMLNTAVASLLPSLGDKMSAQRVDSQ